MKIGVLWNVWDNYEDLQLASEIFANLNIKNRAFSKVYLMGAGGCPRYPSKQQLKFLNKFIRTSLPTGIGIEKMHYKYHACYRILRGMLEGLERAQKEELDFLIVTQADAWITDIEKCKTILLREDVGQAAVSVRSGFGYGVILQNFQYYPYIDDHFMIFNLKKIKEKKINLSKNKVNYKPIFIGDGGIHYFLIDFFERFIPKNDLLVYSNVNDGVNQFGEKSRWSLLPWQYQPSTGFLHSNAVQVPELHLLRARFLYFKNLHDFEFSKAYYKKYKNSSKKIVFCDKSVVFFKTSSKDRAIKALLIIYQVFRDFFILYFSRNKVRRLLQKKNCSFDVYKKYKKDLPVHFVNRSF